MSLLTSGSPSSPVSDYRQVRMDPHRKRDTAHTRFREVRWSSSHPEPGNKKAGSHEWLPAFSVRMRLPGADCAPFSSTVQQALLEPSSVKRLVLPPTPPPLEFFVRTVLKTVEDDFLALLLAETDWLSRTHCQRHLPGVL